MKQLNIIFALLLVFLLPSCIKEDLDDCGTFLYFSYLGDFNKEIFPEKIDKVNLYVYDVNGNLVETILLDRNDLKRSQGTQLNLPAGDYHLVCWGNAYGDTQINDDATLRTGIVAAPHYFTKETITTNDSLYIGSKDIKLSGDILGTDTVYFSSAHIKMLVQTSGLEGETSSPFDIVVENVSSTVDFSKNFSTEKSIYYPLSVNSSDGIFDARFNVLRFNDVNDVRIKLVNKETNTVVYNLSLKDFMAENNITVNGINEAFVGISFRFNGLSVTVKPWDEEIITPGV